jgi:hypothetical protein
LARHALSVGKSRGKTPGQWAMTTLARGKLPGATNEVAVKTALFSLKLN